MKTQSFKVNLVINPNRKRKGPDAEQLDELSAVADSIALAFYGLGVAIAVDSRREVILEKLDRGEMILIGRYIDD